MPASPHPPLTAVRRAVRLALEEDLTPLGDVTSALVDPGRVAVGAIRSRAAGVLAGRRCADETFEQVDPSVEVRWDLDDGARLEPDSVCAIVEGPLASVLTAERTALNFLGHLSGIATATRRFVDAADPLQVWDTRKTTPGLRALEKAAVRAGGGVNHRGNLSEWVMFKDNHLVGLGIAEGVRRARTAWPVRSVQVECDTLDQVAEALEAGVDAILLDNMTPDEVQVCVELAAETGSARPRLEVSGGVTLENVARYAATGADLVSSGALTNSAPVLDIGLDLREVR